MTCIIAYRTNVCKHTVGILGPRLWNSLSDNIRQVSSLYQFKSKMKEFLLSCMQTALIWECLYVKCKCYTVWKICTSTEPHWLLLKEMFRKHKFQSIYGTLCWFQAVYGTSCSSTDQFWHPCINGIGPIFPLIVRTCDTVP